MPPTSSIAMSGKGRPGGMTIGSPRSRTASYLSDASSELFEKAGDFNWGIEQGGEKSGLETILNQGLNVMRAAALLTAILKEASLDDGISITEYAKLTDIVLEEGKWLEEFFSQLSQQYPQLQERVDWLRIAQSAELAIPRFYLCLLVARAIERPLTVTLFRNLQGMALGIGDPIRGLVAHQQLIKWLIEKPSLPIMPLEPEMQFYSNPTPQSSSMSSEERIQLLLEEFAFMNRLWCRLYDFKNTGERDLAKRHEASHFVVTSIQAMAQLLGVMDLNVYRNVILLFYMEHSVGCCDEVAQELILQTVLSSFPSSFHRQTVEILIDAVSRFAPTVNIRRLVGHILECILGGAKEKLLGLENNDDNGLVQPQVFDDIWHRISSLMDFRRDSIPRRDIFLLITPLLQYSLRNSLFAAERTEGILNFMANLASVEDETRRIELPLVHIGRTVDYVVEFIPHATDIFSLPSLFVLLELLIHQEPAASPTSSISSHSDEHKRMTHQSHSAFSCASMMVERLANNQVRIEQLECVNLLCILLRAICEASTSWEMNEDLELMAEQIGAIKTVVHRLFKEVIGMSILCNDEAEKKFLATIFHNGDGLVVTLFGEAYMEAVIGAGKGFRMIKFLKDFRKWLSSHNSPGMTFARNCFETAEASLKPYLGYLLCDASYACLIEWWARFIELSMLVDNNEMTNYEAILEMLLVYEEDIVDRDVQMIALQKIISLLAHPQVNMTAGERSSLLVALVKHCRRLLFVEDKRLFFTEILLALNQRGIGDDDDGSILELVVKESVGLFEVTVMAIDNRWLGYYQALIRCLFLHGSSYLSPMTVQLVKQRFSNMEGISGEIEDYHLKSHLLELLGEWEKVKTLFPMTELPPPPHPKEIPTDNKPPPCDEAKDDEYHVSTAFNSYIPDSSEFT